MISVKKGLLVFFMISFIFTGISEGETFRFEINANASDVEGKASAQHQLFDASLNIGTGFLRNDNDFWISNINLAIKDEILITALTLGVGFDGSFGEVEIHDIDYDLIALGFLIFGEYDFRRISSVFSIPVCTNTSFSFSPNPLGFKDTKRYIKFTFGIDAFIVNNAAITVGYRHINTHFDTDPGEIKKSDNAVYFGCKLIF